MEVYNRLLIVSLCFMAIDRNNNHFVKILTLAISSHLTLRVW